MKQLPCIKSYVLVYRLKTIIKIAKSSKSQP